MLNALGLGYSETKIKPYLKMGVQRVQIANNKRITSVKIQKKELAALLADKKDEKARIKVEHIIRDDFLIEAYELIELLCDLLHERIRQVTTSKDTPPEDLKETVYSLVWAATNCDITELTEVRKHLIRKYGSEFFKVVDENPSAVVNARLFNKLSYRPPGRVLVNRYLVEIAKFYNIEWEAPIECELVDEEAPFSTPSGFSIAMAPGSGIAQAYSTPPAPTATAVSGKAPSAPPSGPSGRKLSPAEQEEYDQFHKHQKSPVQLTSPPEPIYAAVPGPPPHLKNAAAPPATGPAASGSTGTAGSGKGEGLSPGPTAGSGAGSCKDSDDDSGAVFTPTAAAAAAQAPHAPPPPAAAGAPAPPAPPAPPSPVSPPPAAPAPSAAGEDPMQAMLARLAALK